LLGGIRYSAYVTTAAISDDLVWEVYKHRAEAENQIKELKMEYGLDGFCFKDMAATEFAFRGDTIHNAISFSYVGFITFLLYPEVFVCLDLNQHLTSSVADFPLQVDGVPTHLSILTFYSG
jgi:hypothetical protein